VAIFAVDLINLLYISMLGEQAIAAAVGFAGVVGFFHAVGVHWHADRHCCRGVAAIGAQRMAEARALGTSSLVICALLAVALTVGLTLFLADPFAASAGGRRPRA
jgi:hypothetical protein